MCKIKYHTIFTIIEQVEQLTHKHANHTHRETHTQKRTYAHVAKYWEELKGKLK